MCTSEYASNEFMVLILINGNTNKTKTKIHKGNRFHNKTGQDGQDDKTKPKAFHLSAETPEASGWSGSGEQIKNQEIRSQVKRNQRQRQGTAESPVEVANR